jgi:hypothetical protein
MRVCILLSFCRLNSLTAKNIPTILDYSSGMNSRDLRSETKSYAVVQIWDELEHRDDWLSRRWYLAAEKLGHGAEGLYVITNDLENSKQWYCH